MSRRPRLLIGAAAAALTAGALVAVTSPSASADNDAPAASANSMWLAGKMDDGRFTNPLGGGDDEGLMIDAIYAMYASGDGARAKRTVDVLDREGGVLNYISYAEWLPDGDRDRIGGATAKTLLAAQVAGADPHDFGGLDMVEETKSVIVKARDFEPGGRFAPDGEFPNSGINRTDIGRVADFGPYTNYNNANTFGQTLATIALAREGELTGPVVKALTNQRCSEGYFRIFYYYNDDQSLNTCDQGKAKDQSAPDGDTTGFALSAMLAAKKSGVAGLDDEIDGTVDWLVANQTAGGGWGGGVGTEAPNTNSTGLIVQGLADAGAPRATINRGLDYLRSAQVTSETDGGTQLADELGAIAYSPEDRQQQQDSGIVGLDTWIRAGTQASLGLSQVGFWDLSAGPSEQPGEATVTAPAGFLKTGAKVSITGQGLDPNEPFTARLRKQTLLDGSADAQGDFAGSINIPATLADGTYPLVVTGTDSQRTAKARLKVLAGQKKLAVKVSRKAVKKGKKVTITGSRLAAGEKVTITGGGVRITGKADAQGKVSKPVKLTKVGKTTLRLIGGFPQRKGQVVVKVTKR